MCMQYDFLCNIIIYAEDTILFSVAPSVNQAFLYLQSDFQAQQKSVLDLKVVLNAKKTKYMLFSRSYNLDLQLKSDIYILLSQIHLNSVFHNSGHLIQVKMSCLRSVRSVTITIKSSQILFVTYTWLADVNASVLLVPTMQ